MKIAITSEIAAMTSAKANLFFEMRSATEDCVPA